MIETSSRAQPRSSRAVGGAFSGLPSPRPSPPRGEGGRCFKILLFLSLGLMSCQLLTHPADCANGKIDGRETDLDCGGQCGGCAVGRICLLDQDCASQVCAVNHCVEPTCSDGVRNGPETDVDCGGGCGPCANARSCTKPTDCLEGACIAGSCATPSCMDGSRDGLETDVDCGGPCAPCANGLACQHNVDCIAGTCADGRCGGACPFPLRSCGGTCVDPRFDRAHCGGCGMPCVGNDICLGGQCASPCPGGTQSCGGTCVDPGSNPLHCGGCGRPCAAGMICVGGACNPQCAPGQMLCGADCVSVMFDGLHCGGCNQPCATGTACVGGQCSAGCTSPLMTCTTSPTCIDPRNDPDHCGGCVTACPPRQNAARACVSNSCTLGACQPGFDDCNAIATDGCETQLGVDPANCGQCGRACAGSETCTSGRCCGALPAGSYQATCSGCQACDGLLSCLCRDAAQTPRPTSLPLGCFNITNCNGVLLCNGC